MLFAGIKKADAKALASFSASSPCGWPWRCMIKCPNSCAASKRLCSPDFWVFRKTKGVPFHHIENASTSLASIAKENTRTPFASRRWTILRTGCSPSSQYLRSDSAAVSESIFRPRSGRSGVGNWNFFSIHELRRRALAPAPSATFLRVTPILVMALKLTESGSTVSMDSSS